MRARRHQMAAALWSRARRGRTACLSVQALAEFVAVATRRPACRSPRRDRLRRGLAGACSERQRDAGRRCARRWRAVRDHRLRFLGRDAVGGRARSRLPLPAERGLPERPDARGRDLRQPVRAAGGLPAAVERALGETRAARGGCYRGRPRGRAAAPAMPTARRPAAAASPMIAQYQALKAEHPECLLFFRMGDFYELFFEDAQAAAPALDIALTRRGRHQGDDIPMCGVPVHSAESYLERLIRKGFKVAICEQTEDPAEARRRGGKTLVRREIIRLVTPGTLTEDSLLEARRHNFLAALARSQQAHGARLARHLDRRVPDRAGRGRHAAGRARAHRARRAAAARRAARGRGAAPVVARARRAADASARARVRFAGRRAPPQGELRRQGARWLRQLLARRARRRAAHC